MTMYSVRKRSIGLSTMTRGKDLIASSTHTHTTNSSCSQFYFGNTFFICQRSFLFFQIFLRKIDVPPGYVRGAPRLPTPYYNIFKQPLSSVFQKFFKNFFRSIDKNISIKNTDSARGFICRAGAPRA